MTTRTPRLLIRPLEEGDRPRFVELFCDPEFMVFNDAVDDARAANQRFEHLLRLNTELTIAKQPIVERATGTIIGYIGVDRIMLDGEQWLELGYRLAPDSRGRGYATEAGHALLGRAAETFSGELLAIIHPDNRASTNVAEKLGFTFWQQAPVLGEIRNLFRLRIGA